MARRLYGWGGSSITKRDWHFLSGVINRYSVKSVLEFGSGMSTYMFSRVVDRVVTYEALKRYKDLIEVQFKLGNVEVRHWDGQKVGYPGDFDLAFVDGPMKGEKRGPSTKCAADHCDLVVIHDSKRKWEKLWQEKYLYPGFNVESRGGSCCLWVRKINGGYINTDAMWQEKEAQG